MQELPVIWLSLLACLAVTGFAGVRLSRYGEAIAEKTAPSRNWVGLILLAEGPTSHAFSAFSAMMMSGLVSVSRISLLLLVIYLLNTLFLYLHGH